MRKKYLWKKAIQKACSATEGVDRSLANYLIKSASIKRHFYWINGNKSLDNLYRSFVITIAFELHMFNTKEVSWSLAFAILDNWFELNNIDSQEIRSQVNTEELSSVLNSKIKLYREYFLLYDDPFGIDVIRVHFPLGNFYSVDVKVNLSRGTEYGFFRSGFSYYKVEGQSEQATTLIAVVGDREVYKFGCYSFSWILTHFRLIKSIKVYKETESILNQDENDEDNENKKKEE